MLKWQNVNIISATANCSISFFFLQCMWYFEGLTYFENQTTLKTWCGSCSGSYWIFWRFCLLIAQNESRNKWSRATLRVVLL